MEPPACDPGDSCIAQRAESTLFIPEIAKSAGTSKRFQHVSPFPFFEVGFIGWIVRVSFAFDLDVPFDGSALGVYSQTLFGFPSSSQVSPKKDQSRFPRCPKYFDLSQREFLFGCLRRAHC